MTIIITMAGMSKRFLTAGYTIPKYRIEVNGSTLFYWSLLSLSEVSSKKYIFVVRKEDNATQFIQAECRKLGIQSPTIHEIDFHTSGQAETAALAEPYWDEHDSLLIYNIDTYVEAGAICDEQFHGDGFIPCFSAPGNHWSFARTDRMGKVVEVREKMRISNHCTIGAYYFRAAQLYMKLYREYYLSGNRPLEAGERYVAPLYNWLICEKKGDVYISDIPPERVHVLGTPEELDDFRRNYKKVDFLQV